MREGIGEGEAHGRSKGLAEEEEEEQAEAEVIDAVARDTEAEEQGRQRTGSEQEGQVLLLKKDSEQFDNADMGLANTVHKIGREGGEIGKGSDQPTQIAVKGGIQRVEGNRVYLKVAKEDLTEQELYRLITYLDRKIAQVIHP